MTGSPRGNPTQRLSYLATLPTACICALYPCLQLKVARYTLHAQCARRTQYITFRVHCNGVVHRLCPTPCLCDYHKIFAIPLAPSRFHWHFCDSIDTIAFLLATLRFHWQHYDSIGNITFPLATLLFHWHLCDSIDTLASFLVTCPTCGVDSAQIYSSTFA